MSESLHLSPVPPERTSLDYSALREEGMELIRQLAKLTWTDHNVHDPGITLLEAFSYAMTELGFRIQLDMADLLESGRANVPPDLVPAHRALASGPVTTEDLRSLLLDHPAVGDALIAPDADGEVPFYSDPNAAPPFTYTPFPGAAAVRVSGLHEILVAFGFDDRELNSNTYLRTVDAVGGPYTIEVALPHWDDEEAARFREGATVAPVPVPAPSVDFWRPLPEFQAFFGEMDVVTGDGDTVELWALLRIIDPVEMADLPAVLTAAEAAVRSTAAGSLKVSFAERVRAADGAVGQIERYVAGWRNLGEDSARLSAAREQEIGVSARIEVTGGADLEQLLAEIFLAIDRELSPPLSFHSLEEMRDRGRDIEEIFDGPLLSHGFLDREELQGLARPKAIYVSDLLRVIMRLRAGEGTDVVAQENPTGRDIVAVTDLRLSNFINNRPIVTGARDCLRLVETDRYRARLSLGKCAITIVRDDHEVEYDLARVRSLFSTGQQEDRDAALTDDPSPVLSAPAGESLAVEDYYPFQNDLPRVYGLGEAGLVESASTERKARALQAKGYLVLFEQLLSDLAAQIGNVNRFFSPDPDETSTYFTQPLFDLSGMQRLLRRFPQGGDWDAFVASAENPHRQALQEAVEDRDRFLDRRNRMLDHLLARHGEETVAWGQELHRWAQAELNAANVPLPDLPGEMAERRRSANERLVRDKASLLANVAELNAFRLLAFGMLLLQSADLLRVEEVVPEGEEEAVFDWVLAAGGEDRLRAASSADAEDAATAAGADAASLAGQVALYDVVHVGGGFRRYRLLDRIGSGARVLGESPTTFPNVPAAQAALQETAALFAALRLNGSLTPMERLVSHLTGIRSQRRRRLAIPRSAFFELIDAAGGDGVVDGWRLRAQAGPAGPILLEGVGPFVGADDAEATAAAEAAIDRAARYGLDEWSYEISETVPGVFELALHDAAGDAVAAGPGTFASEEEAEAAFRAAIERLYASYSAEGCHLVEHVLLRPREVGDGLLDLPLAAGGSEADPYSQRLSLVLPSGLARDFSLPEETAPRTDVAPHRFRDPEFRRHAERMVRRACPAHLLPTIHWVDRDLSPAPAQGSFEGFEARYFTWLETVLNPGGPAVAVRTARNELVLALNAVANG